jgi:hypothetical protein
LQRTGDIPKLIQSADEAGQLAREIPATEIQFWRGKRKAGPGNAM